MHAAIVSSSSRIPELPPGAALLLLGLPEQSVALRLAGFQLQDAFAILLPGPCARFAFLLRKPNAGLLEGILSDRTGALNIDGCRTEGRAQIPWGKIRSYRVFDNQALDSAADQEAPPPNPLGRWPANVAFVHGAECHFLGREEDDTPRWECAKPCPLGFFVDPAVRYFPQFANRGDLIAWFQQLITPPERECFVSV